MKTKTVKFYFETLVRVDIPERPKNAIETDEEWETSMIGQKGEELAFGLDGNVTFDRYAVQD